MAHNHETLQLNRMLIICSIINLLYVAIEAGVGFAASSAGLVSDAGHNLSDVATLLISLAAVNLDRTRTDRRYYGSRHGRDRNNNQRRHRLSADAQSGPGYQHQSLLSAYGIRHTGLCRRPHLRSCDIKDRPAHH